MSNPAQGADGAETMRGNAVREALKEIQEAADAMLISLPDRWHDDATIRLTDAASDARTVLAAAAQDDLYALSSPRADGDGAAADVDLNERLRAAGMFTIPEMMGETPLTRWEVHTAMKSLDAFGWWLDSQVRQYLTMKAKYDLSGKPEGDELYEWVLAHAAAYRKIRVNFEAARKASPAPTPGQAVAVPDSLRARFQQAIDGFESEAADAHDMGERPDLWDEVVEVPVSDVRDVLKALAAHPAGQGAERRPLRLAVTEEWLRREGEADAIAECEAGVTASAHTRGAGAAGAAATVPAHILAMAQAMADGRALAWEQMRYGPCVPQHHSRSYWVMLAQDADAVLTSHPAGQSAGSGAEGSSPRPWTFGPSDNEVAAQIYDATGVSVCEFWSDKPNRDADAALIVAAVNAAPDSTRTGQGEAEADEPVATVLWFDPAAHPIAENKSRKIIEASLAFMEAAEIGTKLYARPLAARPAAPEAQGAWRPISTAPKEKGLLWLYEPHGLGGYMYVGAWNGTAWKNNIDYADQQPSHWMPLPAPPSSGQGGR